MSRSYDYENDPYQPGFRTARPPARSSFAPWFYLLVVLGVSGYGAHWGWKERQRLLAQVGDTEKLTHDLQDASGRIKVLEAEKGTLAVMRESLEKSVEAKDAELAALKGTHDQLQEKMKAEIAKGDIALSQDGTRLRVDLVDKILFDSGKTQVSKSGENVLARMGSVLAAMEGKQVQVSGHTDDRPISEKLRATYPTNWELSMARAMNVVRFLEAQGVPPQKLVASGHGQYAPIASNKTNRGRARNRRIEILLTPALAPRAVALE